MDNLFFCPKCARIQDVYDEDKDQSNYSICPDCGTQMKDTGIPIENDPIVCTHDWYELRRKIYNEMIVPLNQLDKSLKSYKFFYNSYTPESEQKQEEIENLFVMKHKLDEETEATEPKCPICGSNNLSKITVAHKAGKIVLLGIFGMGDNGKTYRCNHCGSKF